MVEYIIRVIIITDVLGNGGRRVGKRIYGGSSEL